MLPFLRFAIIGGSAAGLYVLLNSWALNNWALNNLALGHFTDFPKPLISSVCYGLFILPTYLLQHSFAFQSDAKHATALPRYIAIQLLALLANFGISYVAFDILHISNFFGSIFIIILTSLFSFLALKLWAFSNRGQ